MKKRQKDERFFSSLLSPDLEYCFILDAQNGYKISDLVLLTSYWRLVKRARDLELARHEGNIGEEIQDEMLHRKIGDFIECVHTYDPEKNKVPFVEFLAARLVVAGLKKNKRIRKRMDRRYTAALLSIAQPEKSTDEQSIGEDSVPLLERISGSLPDQESILHKETLSDAFSKRVFTVLSQVETEVIRSLYYRDRTDKEVAKELGKPLKKIRTIERKALRKLRNEIRKQNLFEELNG